MIALIVIGCIVLLLLFIGCLRAGVAVDYSESGFFVSVKVGPVKTQVIPTEKKKKRSEKSVAEDVQKGTEKPKKSVGETLQMVRQYLPLIGEAAGRLKRKIRIDHIFFHLIWGNPDPASAALGYGAANAVMGMLWPLIDHNFRIKKQEIRIDLDYERAVPAVSVNAQLTMTIGQLVAFAVGLGYKILKIRLGDSREKTDKKAVQV